MRHDAGKYGRSPTPPSPEALKPTFISAPPYACVAMIYTTVLAHPMSVLQVIDNGHSFSRISLMSGRGALQVLGGNQGYASSLEDCDQYSVHQEYLSHLPRNHAVRSATFCSRSV
jgi:hypothetical protein